MHQPAEAGSLASEDRAAGAIPEIVPATQNVNHDYFMALKGDLRYQSAEPLSEAETTCELYAWTGRQWFASIAAGAVSP